MRKKVSVVIPCYNAAGYIKDTLSSIFNQDYDNVEIICVNDGSKDNTLEVLNSFAGKGVIVLTKENGGVSSARNMGIKNASGEYIVFVDADDKILPDYITMHVDAMEKYDADFVISRQINVANGKRIPRPMVSEETLIENSDEVLGLICAEKVIISMVASKMYKTELAKKILFDENMRIAEDFKYCVDYLGLAKKTVLIPYAGYLYEIRENSLSHGKFKPGWFDEIHYVESLAEKYKGTQIEDLVKRRLLRVAIDSVIVQNPSREDRKELIKHIIPLYDFGIKTSLLGKRRKEQLKIIVKYPFLISPYKIARKIIK